MTPAPEQPGGDSPHPPAAGRSWRDRIDDPREPLYTMGVVSELLDLDPQALRRLETVLDQASARPSGNQRRFSRRDIDLLAQAAGLAAQGIPPAAIGHVLDLQHQLDDIAANARGRRERLDTADRPAPVDPGGEPHY